MIFSSITFLFYFLPIMFFLYYIVPFKYKNIILLLSSLFFYAWGEPKYVLLLLFSVWINFVIGKQIPKHRFLLYISLFLNIGLLVLFKYSTMLFHVYQTFSHSTLSFPELALPLGISFYTFQIMSYMIDVYRGTCAPQKSFLHFATYVTLFPQLIAGPIVRYTDVREELISRTPEYEKGIYFFLIGLSQKVLLANNIGLIWKETLSYPFSSISTPTAWLSLLAYAFQIYFDFCGYSNMAIGLGHVLGFHFPVNFNKPYMSKSITEFWSRWHISLSSWFKEYVYIPLGGNRKGLLRQLINILIVWSLTGIWHGASFNFLLWGLYFAFLLVLEKLFLKEFLEKLPRIMQHLYALFTILTGWVLFAFDSTSDLISFYHRLFQTNISFDSHFLYLIRNNWLIFILCIIISSNLVENLIDRVVHFFHNKGGSRFMSNENTLISSRNLLQAVKHILLLLCFLLSVSYIVDDSYNPFLYFRF